MSEVADLRIGKILDNRYTITRRIADGGMASVYEATDNRLERSVAIKIIHAQLAQGPHREQFLHRFHSEAKAAAALTNPHIVQVYDTGEFEGLQYIVMEYIHGVNLRQAMERTPIFSVRDTLRVLSETLDGLAAAHQAGLMHRDIKPENILLNSRGHVQIADFGLAKAVSDATMSTTGLLLGTASYLPPEMIESNRSTPQGDLYSVGIMGYEMLSGQVPFTSSNPITTVFKHVHDDVPALSSISSDFPKPIVDFLTHLTARDPEQRPADASAALKELRDMAKKLKRDQLFYIFTPVAAVSVAGAAAASSTKSGDITTALTPPTNTQDAATERLYHTQSAPVINQNGNATTSPAPNKESVQDSTDRATTTSILNADSTNQQSDNEAPAKGKELKTKDPKKRKRNIIILVASVFVIALSGLLAWWWFMGPGSYWVVPQASDKPCTKTSCTLTGADFTEYQKTLEALGIEYTSSQDYSDTVAKGDIVSADPDVNGHVNKRNGKLHLVVSQGIKKVTVPADLLDCERTPNALKTLKTLGLTNLDVEEEYSLDAAEGCAISSSVEANATINHNSSVKLVVSKGPKPVTIPQLAGVSQSDATARLETLKLSVKVTQEFSDSIASGSVVKVVPSENSEAHWGDTVTLTISKGPEMVQMPSLVGTNKDAAVKKLEALGFTVKTQSSPIGETLHLVLQQKIDNNSVDGGAQVRLRDTSGKPTVITLVLV